MIRVPAAVLCLACLAGSASAQEVSAGIEWRRDRLDYHFDNPSTFDTPGLVPHFFEQRYDADNVWLRIDARYGGRWETSFGVTPQRDTTADDYDTFFDPDQTVWVSGTTGPANVTSLSAAQFATVAGRRSNDRHVMVGYRFRLDRFDFGVGHKTVTRNGALVAATDVTSRETTRSQLHELLVAIDVARQLASPWSVSARGEIAPLTVGRLLVELPDKYPGQDLVFVAKAFGASARVAASRAVGTAWRVGIEGAAGRTWSYRSTDAVRLTSIVGTFTVARRW